MPKLKNKFPSELDIEELKLKDNIRKEYRDIPDMANSLKKFGQLQPIGIDKDYNIIFGHRRYFGAKYLLEKGERIKLKVQLIQGDRKTLQSIENFHQSKMSASEEEQCIESFIADGMKQKEVAEILCLTPQRINDMRAGGRTREKLEDQGIETEKISTSGLSAMRSVDPEKMPEVIEKAKEKGGTSVGNIKKAVKEISKEAEEYIFDEKETKPKDLVNDIVVTKAKSETASFEDTGLSVSYCTVKCSANCKNNLDGYCDLKVIEIGVVGVCGNFEEG